MRSPTKAGSIAFALCLLVLVIAGCEQTRPIPRYEPLLTLAANQPRQAEAYRPAWAGPRPAMPATARGGG